MKEENSLSISEKRYDNNIGPYQKSLIPTGPFSLLIYRMFHTDQKDTGDANERT